MSDERRPEQEAGQGWGQPPGAPPPPQQPPQGWGQPPGAPPQQQPPPQGWGQPPGAPPPQQAAWGAPGPPAQATNGLAIAALVCGLLALPLTIFLVGGFVGLVAVVLGIAGLSRAGTIGTGRGMAIGGIIAGALGMLVAVALVAVGLRVLSDPEVQDMIEQEMERQEQLLEEQQQE